MRRVYLVLVVLLACGCSRPSPKEVNASPAKPTSPEQELGLPSPTFEEKREQARAEVAERKKKEQEAKEEAKRKEAQKLKPMFSLELNNKVMEGNYEFGTKVRVVGAYWGGNINHEMVLTAYSEKWQADELVRAGTFEVEVFKGLKQGEYVVIEGVWDSIDKGIPILKDCKLRASGFPGYGTPQRNRAMEAAKKMD